MGAVVALDTPLCGDIQPELPIRQHSPQFLQRIFPAVKQTVPRLDPRPQRIQLGIAKHPQRQHRIGVEHEARAVVAGVIPVLGRKNFRHYPTVQSLQYPVNAKTGRVTPPRSYPSTLKPQP